MIISMNNPLYEEVYKLRDQMKSDPRFLALKEMDEKLNNNEEVMKLAYQKEMAIVEYEDALNHYGKNSVELKKAQQNLAKCKLNLDNHPLVKEYYLALQKVREMDRKVNEKLFDDFNMKEEEK